MGSSPTQYRETAFDEHGEEMIDVEDHGIRVIDPTDDEVNVL